MKELTAALIDWGCDAEGALERMSGDEDFWEECLLEIPGDPCYGELHQALLDGDAKRGFDAAHTLKGVFANTGLAPMYLLAARLVEPLRAGDAGGLMELYDALMEMNAHLSLLLMRHAERSVPQPPWAAV